MHIASKFGAYAGIGSSHTAALKCLFNISDDDLRDWHGITAYCRYLEMCFEPLLSTEYSSVWHVISSPTPKISEDCWPLFTKTISAIRKRKGENSSIEDIYDSLVGTQQNTQATTTRRDQKAACLIAVFSVLCWATMTCCPKLVGSDLENTPRLRVVTQQSVHPGLRLDAAQRPIPAIFRQFQRTMVAGRWRHPVGESETVTSTILHVSSLNYASLRTIGKISLVWVDDLTSHLDFDAKTRRLAIFRFPSFCAMSTRANDHIPFVFAELIRAMYAANYQSGEAEEPSDFEVHKQLHQEVLMSYRVLFAQSVSARRLVRAELKTLRETSGEYDHLLDIVCGQKLDSKVRALPSDLWPVTCRSIVSTVHGSVGVQERSSLQEQTDYSSQDDFPLFGQRLAKLQAFNLRQQPSKLRDLWRDRRNPLQWYTFWAVVVVGGISILLGSLQLIVGILQLVTSWPGSSCSS